MEQSPCRARRRLVHVAPLLEMFGKWDDFLSRGLSDEETEYNFSL